MLGERLEYKELGALQTRVPTYAAYRQFAVAHERFRITSYNVCYTKLLRIIEVNQQAVTAVADFERLYNGEGKAKGVLLVLIKRQGRNVIRTITVPQK